MIDNKTIYELAFHLNPNLEEMQVQQLAQNVENHITFAGGVVSFKKEPEKIRLSYPVKHKKQAYFGYIHFNLAFPAEATFHLEKISAGNIAWYFSKQLVGRLRFQIRVTTKTILKRTTSLFAAPLSAS